LELGIQYAFDCPNRHVAPDATLKMHPALDATLKIQSFEKDMVISKV